MRRTAAVFLLLGAALAALVLPLRDRSATRRAPAIAASPALAQAFREALCRVPTDAETVQWETRAWDPAVLHGHLASTEEGQRVAAVRAAFQAVLLRDPVPAACDDLRAYVDGSAGLAGIEASLRASAEGRHIAAVRAAYRDAFGRDAGGWDVATLRYWADRDLSPRELRTRLVARRPLVGVHFFPWYRSVEGRWGNGDAFVDAGAPRPVLGWYESHDVNVIDAQIRQIVAAGFDFVVVHVSPEQPTTWAAAHTFFRRLGSRARAAILLDDLYTAPPAQKAQWAETARDEFTRYANYLTHHDRPLVMLFSAPLDFAVPGVTLRNVYWTDRYAPGENTFNPGMTLEAHDWPFWAPVPQPLVNGLVPVIPGYRDTHLGRVRSMEHPRDGGATYHAQWQHALRMRPDLIVVYSWNEHFEQTAIEPTDAWGDDYVRWTACYIDHARRGTIGPCR